MDPNYYPKIRSVALGGGLKNVFLASLKITFGVSGHSHALLADGLHSLTDLFIDSIVVIASKFAHKEADADHPYGHGRIETAATVFLALLLALTALIVIINAVFTLTVTPSRLTSPSIYILWIAGGSLLLNELVYYWTKHVAQQVKSKLLMTNAWHHRSDSISSLAVTLSTIGVWFGFRRLDALTAIFVGLMILKAAWDFGWQSVCELVDTAAGAEELENIKKSIIEISGVKAIHQLRTRSIAGTLFCDVHILVDPTLSVSEGHFISQKVERYLIATFPNIADVTVHVDIEDDEQLDTSSNLPDRAVLQNILERRWGKLLPRSIIKTAVFHYLNGKIVIELKLPFGFANRTYLEPSLKKIKELEEFIMDINIFYYKDG